MADVVVDAEVGTDGGTVACAKIANGEWEVNVRATPFEFAALRTIRDATWTSRHSIAVGTSAGAAVFWSCDGPTASILIGSDDETWDVAVTIPVEDVDRVIELVADL
ncbi:hypothetical protein [Nocardioides sp. URHA0020]|uniref:hypothetical protein n=1 Tax=Nocardioides sp. URHA0020 TaxID=1380392 RepID=UPI00048D8DC2|nr:hypothetical protein [Nocardioides sp. URHA0020]